jgi:hypothetical protein
MKPGQATSHLREAVEELARIGVRVPPFVQFAPQAGDFATMIRNTPADKRDLEESKSLLADFRKIKRRGRRWAVALRATIPTNERQEANDRPALHWDEETRTLYLKDQPIKRYNRNLAPNQIDIIEAFERAGWPPAVDDPFGDARKLNQTLADLNKALTGSTIRFHGDGTGERVIWEFTT